MSVVYRDERGVEYVSVSLPRQEVTEAVPIDARRVRRWSPRPNQSSTSSRALL